MIAINKKNHSITPIDSVELEGVHYKVKANKNQNYTYNINSSEIIKEYEVIKNINVKIIKELKIKEIRKYIGKEENYICVVLNDNKIKRYREKDFVNSIYYPGILQITNTLEYLKEISKTFLIEKESILYKQFSNIKSIDNKYVLSSFLFPDEFPNKVFHSNNIIFPFGSNLSQLKAVSNAFENKISIIEGPPGTGKTQTILNILANIIVNNQKALIVSNNNSATDNIADKFQQYNLDFLIAKLGSKSNKDKFVGNQSAEVMISKEWDYNIDINSELDAIKEITNSIKKIYESQNKKAKLKIELSDLRLELDYFNNLLLEEFNIKKVISSDDLFELWSELEIINSYCKKIPLMYRFKNFLKTNIIKINDIDKLIFVLKKEFYNIRINEINLEINNIDDFLKIKNANKMQSELKERSMMILKKAIFIKYNGKPRKIFDLKTMLSNTNEFQDTYPVVLSSTHSSYNTLGNNAEYDFVIMDEGSQVDIVSGALSLTFAKNAVIVGDLKQLPHIVDSVTFSKSDELIKRHKLSSFYHVGNYSFLSSVSNLIKDVPKTLLKEHYRCHPMIINFCNKKFYNNELVIMTNDNKEKDVLVSYQTVIGNHKRDNFNQREIDVIEKELLTKFELAPESYGIICPYRQQTNKINQNLNEQIANTVHKFQGKENDAIILSVVDDKITKFVSSNELINVAVSRAKKQFFVISSGNPQKKNNITDLIEYINYNNFDNITSEITSVFDMLYDYNIESRINYLKKYNKVSEHNSENIMYATITETLKKMPFLDVIVHYNARNIRGISDGLSKEEKKYILNHLTHFDFVIYNKTSKTIVLIVEVDGYKFHKEGTEQYQRDIIKNRILEYKKIPFIRFKTNGSGEESLLESKLKSLLDYDEHNFKL